MDLDILNIDYKNVLKESVANSTGIKTYYYLVQNATEIDVSNDVEYQKTFSKFYGINGARRGNEWKKIYYDYFQSVKGKGKDLTFSDIVTYLYKKTQRVEISFSSKMLATINMDKPIYDKYISKVFKLDKEKRDTVEEAIQLYKKLEEIYSKILQDEKYKDFIAEFDLLFPDYKCKISEIKKLDFIFWTYGKQQNSKK